MKIFRCDQIKDIDEYTIKQEPVSSIDLMERAAGELYKWIKDKFSRSDKFTIFVGPGNNGGDGLVLARMLADNRYDVKIFYIQFTKKTSDNWEVNAHRLKTETQVRLYIIESTDDMPKISSEDIIIDAIFGSGLAHPVEGLAADLIRKINMSGAKIISIDMPSGLFGEDNSANNYENIVKADFTLSFQFPKLSFMFSENANYAGNWEVLNIGLNSSVISSTFTPYIFIENPDIVNLLKTRSQFDHKGNFGHGLLVSGSLGKMGAAVMGAEAALRTGIGLITCHIPSFGSIIVQSSLPEAMLLLDKSLNQISEVGKTDIFNAVGVGPGISTEPQSQIALFSLLSECKKPMVIDADALNILSLNKEWLSLLHEGTILTPHLKEFERLAGKTDAGFDRMKRQIEFSKENNCIVVLKGAHTSVTTPEGKVMFNSTGNPGMAKGGSGDVLTGIILSLLAQGYTPENAAVTGVYLHGLAGDIAVNEFSIESIIASDIINCIGKAFNYIRHNGARVKRRGGELENGRN
jgi:ADP-dependent NAD(P)H-hydrate dehydratase / NAD(P)H-hydrate epimerase